MKKTFSRIALFALTLATVACSKSDIDDISPIPDTPDTPAASERVSVTATISGADKTRVTLTPDTDDADQPIVKIDWNADGETFAVINGSNKAVFEQTSGNNFEGTLPEGDGEGEPTYRGIYPASAASDDGCTFTIDLAEQTGALDESKTFMLATSDTGLDYEFQHTTALLRPTFKVGDDALSNAVITKVVVKNTTTSRAIPCFAGTQATDTTGDIIINRPTPSADDIYIYMCKPYSGGEKIDVLVYATDNGIDKLYEGSINVPEGKSLTMGNLYTPTVTLSEIAPSNTILYYATNELVLEKFGTDYTHTFAGGVGRIIKKDGNWESLPEKAFAVTAPAFERGLTKVILPETITTVGLSAFAMIISLEEVIMPGVTIIPTGGIGTSTLFARCSNLKRVEIPKIEEIGLKTFSGLSALKEVVLPTSGSGYTIGQEAFTKCTSLTKINLSMATSLGNNCFAECTALESVDLPKAESLGLKCFNKCNSLQSVTLGENIATLNGEVFSNCSQLSSVTIKSLTPPTLEGADWFKNCPKFKIYVPASAVDDYKNAWSDYADLADLIYAMP